MRRLQRLLIPTLLACACTMAVHAQENANLYIVRYLEALPASQAAVARLIKQFAESSRAQGPLRFEVLQETSHPNQFVMLEIWKDQRALDAHASAAPTRQFGDQLAPLLLAPPDERLGIPGFVAPIGDRTGAVYVVTHVDVPPPSRDMVLTILQTLAEVSRKEAGNVRFDAVQQKDRNNHFEVIDVWSDQKSEGTHQVAPHTLAFRRQLGPILGALYDQRWYKPF
jgi:quinol monooxygenase YgiN